MKQRKEKIKVKGKEDVKYIKELALISSDILKRLSQALAIGISTLELEVLSKGLFKRFGVESAFKGYNGYPAMICTSVNEQVVHGIPNRYRLKEGDIISIDVGVKAGGYYADVAATYAVGSISMDRVNLIKATKEALYQGLNYARRNNRVGDISWAIQRYIEKQGYSIVRKFVGHSIGYSLHEEPEIPNFGTPHKGPRIKKDMVFCIEPMVNMGRADIRVLSDKWTAITVDKLPSAHFEHMVLITDTLPEILTEW